MSGKQVTQVSGFKNYFKKERSVTHNVMYQKQLCHDCRFEDFTLIFLVHTFLLLYRELLEELEKCNNDAVEIAECFLEKVGFNLINDESDKY